MFPEKLDMIKWSSQIQNLPAAHRFQMVPATTATHQYLLHDQPTDRCPMATRSGSLGRARSEAAKLPAVGHRRVGSSPPERKAMAGDAWAEEVVGSPGDGPWKSWKSWGTWSFLRNFEGMGYHILGLNHTESVGMVSHFYPTLPFGAVLKTICPTKMIDHLHGPDEHPKNEQNNWDGDGSKLKTRGTTIFLFFWVSTTLWWTNIAMENGNL